MDDSTLQQAMGKRDQRKKTLNDRSLRALKPAKRGQRYDVMDAAMPGLGIRITDKGTKTFTLVKRFPGSTNPTRRSLGEFPAISLANARKKASEWIALIERGIDPAVEEERQRQVELHKRANTFGSVADDFIKAKCSKERRGFEAERIIKRELLPLWEKRAIVEIDAHDVRTVVKPIAERAPYMAHNILGVIKRLFGWAIEQGCYGLETSPADRVTPKKFIGERQPRQRVLSDEELFACWRAACRMPYPYAPMLKMLILTGQRHSDVASAPWREFNIGQREWIIAAGRFKSKVGQLVPLTEQMIEILERLPRFKGSDFLFSATQGKKASDIGHRIKKQVDERMVRTLKALARKRGEDPSRVQLEPFVVHDLRRTMRTALTKLKVPSEVAEATIGHGKRGLDRTYNLYAYADERRDALERWAANLRSIVEPPPANVVKLKSRA